MVLVLLKLVEGVVAEPVRADPALWPLIYLPSLVGLAVAAGLLAWSGRTHGTRRKFSRKAVPA